MFTIESETSHGTRGIESALNLACFIFILQKSATESSRNAGFVCVLRWLTTKATRYENASNGLDGWSMDCCNPATHPASDRNQGCECGLCFFFVVLCFCSAYLVFANT